MIMETTTTFKHNVLAGNDPKIAMLEQNMGMEGSGCYWRLLEILATQGDRTLPTDCLRSYAAKMGVPETKLRAVVSNYGLFVFEPREYGTVFYSPALSRQFEEEKRPRKTPARRFEPPTPGEVGTYCDQRHNGVDAEQFCAFYESKGWFVGKNKMKDWKAAVRTWERDRKNTNKHEETRKETRRYAALD
jgi:hypothetical protein